MSARVVCPVCEEEVRSWMAWNVGKPGSDERRLQITFTCCGRRFIGWADMVVTEMRDVTFPYGEDE